MVYRGGDGVSGFPKLAGKPLLAAHNAPVTVHVFVDESARQGKYLLCAAFVEPAQLAPSRRGLAGLLLPGARELHFKKEVGTGCRRVVFRGGRRLAAQNTISGRGGDCGPDRRRARETTVRTRHELSYLAPPGPRDLMVHPCGAGSPAPYRPGFSVTKMAVPGKISPRRGLHWPHSRSSHSGQSGSMMSTRVRPAATISRTRSPMVRWCST